jgi:hypothetical protein
MSGATHPLPNTPSWCGAQLKKKHGDNFTFTFTSQGVLLIDFLKEHRTINAAYEGVTIIFRTESIKKYTLTFSVHSKRF